MRCQHGRFPEAFLVIKVDQFMDVKGLHRRGHLIKKIVQLTGMARNTVRKIIRGEHAIEQPHASLPTERTSLIDPFKEYIRSQVEQYDLSAVRILPEIQKLGGCSRSGSR